ncbi:DNA/RNA non-specific endonuclease [Streptomyces antimycoticus]|uniref:DNA/RNA non-specific endonuclease n=1 Tax=Streptomyces antimycoticus TaxID=68175 RepID=UPI001D1348F5|nr:DNA/RNA non-specific endonuclease [Streptomyces antimycoticus]
MSRGSLADRKGYNDRFLGTTVPLPVPADSGIETVILPYTNFSVVFRPDRRLAAATAVTIDGANLIDVPRNDDWRFDPRLPEAQQAGHPVYEDNPLDKGHLVRRLDPVWGAEASTANSDTFHYTNAAPQMDIFNQGKKLWQGLENFLLDHAEDFDRKLTVFTGPVLEDSDPPYRGIQVPLRFWKVAAFMHDGDLAATAYVLDQSPDLTKNAAAQAMAKAARAGDPPRSAPSAPSRYLWPTSPTSPAWTWAPCQLPTDSPPECGQHGAGPPWSPTTTSPCPPRRRAHEAAAELWTPPLADAQVLTRTRERSRRCPDRRNTT